MRYIFFLLLQLYIPCSASIQTQDSRHQKRRRSDIGRRVRGRTDRRLRSANIFNHDRNDNVDALSGVMKHTALTFKARTMVKTKQQPTGGATGTNTGILDLPRKTTMIMRMGMGSANKGNAQTASSIDDTFLLLEDVMASESSAANSKSDSTKSQKGGGLDLVLPSTDLVLPSPEFLPSKSKAKGMEGKSTSFSQKPKLSKKSKLSKGDMKSMKMDVVKPTIPPTMVPTVSPMTKKPTKTGTPAPTKAQTLAPTRQPTRLPTAEPTGLSAKMPVVHTPAPFDTTTPTATPTGGPTESPTKSLVTGAPTPMGCMVDAAGNVGLMKGDVTLYDFFFQLEVEPGMTAEEVDDNLLKEVEVAMANELIPSLFPKQCSDGRRLQLDAIQTYSLQGRYLGLSTRPPDFVLNGFKCSGIYVEPCYIVSGAKTVYTVGLSEEQIEKEFGADIKSIIQSGILADQFDEIVGMTLLDNNLDPVTPPPIPATLQPTVFVPDLTTLPTIEPTPISTEEPTKAATEFPTPSPPPPPPTPMPTLTTQPPATTAIPTTTAQPLPTTPIPSTITAPSATTSAPTTNASLVPTFATRAPSNLPTDDDEYDPPLFPLWAWTVLGVGLGVLIIICIYLNRGEGHVNLEADEKDDKNDRYQTQSQHSSDGGGDGYVPPSPGLVTQQPPLPQVQDQPNPYLQANNVESDDDSEADNGAGSPMGDIPTNIAVDPDAEGAEYPTDDDDDDEEEEEEEEEEEGEEEEEEEEEEEGEYEEEDEEEEEEEESYEDDEDDNGAQQSVLGEFQVVQVEPKMSFQQEESGSEEEEGSYEEEEEGEEEGGSYEEEEEEGEEEEEEEEEEGSYEEEEGSYEGDEGGEEEEEEEGEEQESYGEESYEDEEEEQEGEEEEGEEDGEGEQIVQVDMSGMDDMGNKKKGEDEGSSYDEESYDEETYAEETYVEATVEGHESYGEESYEEEVIEDDGEDEGEQSWLQELQEAQAGHYPSYKR